MLTLNLPLAMYDRDPADQLRRVGLDWQVFDTLTSAELGQLAVDLRVLADQVDRDLLRRSQRETAGSPKGRRRFPRAVENP